MDASAWIALGALGLSGLVALRGELNLRGERKAREREDERAEKRLQLLSEQVEGEAEHRLSQRRAELVCRQGSRGGRTEGVDEYDVALFNGAQAAAQDVRAWIATADGDALSDAQQLGKLVRDAEPIWFKLYLSTEYSRDRNVRFFLRARWADGAGEHEENIAELGHV